VPAVVVITPPPALAPGRRASAGQRNPPGRTTPGRTEARLPRYKQASTALARAHIPGVRLHIITCYTYLRAKPSGLGLIDVSNQNITLSLPEEDLREARILAAMRGTSVSQLLARMLKELIEQETGYTSARNRSLARLREGMDLGTGGHIDWSRDSVHER
jgi:hypothetical protein